VSRPDEPIEIDPDVARARALPGRCYGEPTLHARLVERAFARSWQPLPPEAASVAPGEVQAFELLGGSVAEPLLAWRDAEGTLRVLSNVCTHRGHPLVESPTATRAARLRCRYHGRVFDPTGRVLAAPGFEADPGRPTACDPLAGCPTASWGPLTLAALPHAPAFDAEVGAALGRVAHVPRPDAGFDPARSRDYEVQASWISYVENYLEGLHIPFVHGALRSVLDLTAYHTEVLDHGVLQVARAGAGEAAFEGPGAPGDPSPVAAYYLWVWPNLMLNLYPWGLSLNVVEPLGPSRTRVRFRSYVRDPALLEQGAGAGLHAVELEDEAIVEACQRGLRARLYDRGRYSPSHERGVHAFHRRIARTLSDDGGA
jgi:choline monooxygenase